MESSCGLGEIKQMLFELCISKQAEGGYGFGSPAPVRQAKGLVAFFAPGTHGGRGGWPVLGESWRRRTHNVTPSGDTGDEEAAVIK